MEELKKAFYEVMYKYEKSFSEEGVLANLNAWLNAKTPLIELLRRHPNWNEEAKAVVLEFKEGRGIERDVVDEIAFNLLTLADEVIPVENRNAFYTAFNAAIGEYSDTLSESRLEIIRQTGGIKCATGQKTSRIIGKLCRKFGMEAHASYNNMYASLSDALNPLQIAKTAVLSVHPCDFLEMSSKSNSWTSCHNLNDGSYQGGTLSYMIDDVTMIFFTVDPDVTDHYYRAPRRTRQLFFYKENCLYQSRLYPGEVADVITQNREIVHKILATCLGVPNLWVLKSKRNEVDCCESAEESAQYADYDYYGNLSFIKGTEHISHMVIGAKPICVCCGSLFNPRRSIKCNCADTVVCTDCGRTVPINQARYDAEAYHCHACLHICSACGRVTRDTMYPAFDRRGNMIEVCLDCYNASTEPCFACSVKGICGIIGNSLCQRAAIQHTTSGVF